MCAQERLGCRSTWEQPCVLRTAEKSRVRPGAQRVPRSGQRLQEYRGARRSAQVEERCLDFRSRLGPRIPQGRADSFLQ